MAITYGFFNSLNGDRTYNADQMSEYFKGLISDGVYENVGGALQVVENTGMNVQVKTGRAVIGSKWMENDAILTVPITAAHVTLNRYTAIVIQLDLTNRNIGIITVDGTNATTPSKPAMTNNSTIMQFCLAYVYVGAGVSSITQANITDTRANKNLCGWVTGLVEQVDTTTLFNQWQAAYNENIAEMNDWQTSMKTQFDNWFNTLTQKLNVTTYIERYYKRVTLNGTTTTIPLDMSGYTYASSDIIFVHVNGLLASENYDYITDTSSTPVQLHPPTSAAGTVVEITVLKSKIGFSTT